MIRRERGSVSVEVAVLAPAFLLLIVLATMVGRVSVAQGAVTIAAHDAARAASLSRDAGAAEQHAGRAARDALAEQGLTCGQVSVEPELDGFAVRAGQPAYVSVTVSCTVSLIDVAIVGLSDSRTVRASFTSPLDTWRERS